jgi:alpha-tubulin suppressor-like RCC1 family protein
MKINILQQSSYKGLQNAFALPTVLIASTVMLAVLTVTLASVQSGTVVALESSHYSRYAKSAAQSGMVMAKACLEANNYISAWSTNPLKPNTNCTGTVQSGLSAYVHNDTVNGVRSTFTVAPPTTLANGTQKITVTSTAERLRQSNGVAFRTYTESSYATVSAQASFSNVAFGYLAESGAFFGVIDPQGDVNTVGYNGNGQLGNGTTVNSATPQAFQLPANLRAARLYTSFLSLGVSMFAITTDGQLYGAGLNSSGQLGNGTTTSPQSTPVKFQLPAGVKAVYVTSGLQFTLVIGDDNNVYSAGNCAGGILGYGYVISGCTPQSTYKRVALPTVNLSDLNTLPVATSDWVQSTNLTTDSVTGLLRMQGGRVYAWGANNFGQLGNGTTTDSSSPVQITTLGNTGQPKATQVAFDGVTSYILDDTGSVWANGHNIYGQTGTASPIGSASGKCIDNPANSTTDATQITIYTCNNSPAQIFEWAENGSLKLRPNTTTEKCIDNFNGNSADGNPIVIYTCNGTVAQKWTMNNDGKIINPVTGKCLENTGNSATNGNGLTLNTCNAASSYSAQQWGLLATSTPSKVLLPSGHGTVKRISTDQHSVLLLMTDGTIWGYGLNLGGQLGSGTLFKYNPKIQQYVLPAGRIAVNFYTSRIGADNALQYDNSFAILDDGSVYGVGSNVFGQLGNGTTSTVPVATPIKMTLPVGVRAQTVQYGLGTTIILTDEGRIYTVGNNVSGQLGDGTTANSSTPQARQYVNNRPIVLY